MPTATRTKQARTSETKSPATRSKAKSEAVVETPEIIDATPETVVETAKTAASAKSTAKVVEAVAQKSKSIPTFEEVSVRAYLLWLERGAAHGGDVQDWLTAERELTGSIG